MGWEGNSGGSPELLFLSRFFLEELSPNVLIPTETVFLSSSSGAWSHTSDLPLLMWLGVMLESRTRDLPGPRFSEATPCSVSSSLSLKPPDSLVASRPLQKYAGGSPPLCLLSHVAAGAVPVQTFLPALSRLPSKMLLSLETELDGSGVL